MYRPRRCQVPPKYRHPSTKSLKKKVHPRTCQECPEGSRYNSTLCLTRALEEGRWSTPRPGRFTPGKIPSNHCTGDSMNPRAGLDGCRKCCSHRNSIPGPSSPWQVATPTTISGPLTVQCAAESQAPGCPGT